LDIISVNNASEVITTRHAISSTVAAGLRVSILATPSGVLLLEVFPDGSEAFTDVFVSDGTGETLALDAVDVSAPDATDALTSDTVDVTVLHAVEATTLEADDMLPLLDTFSSCDGDEGSSSKELL
jgi:hypothetical protein